MSSQLTKEQIAKVVDFHGHWCPGLAIGLRAGEWALKEMGRAQDEEIAAVVETDMCAVDAIQVLTGCTFGKGNLIHLDHGKTAFSFFRRRDGKSARLVFDGRRLGVGQDQRHMKLTQKMLAGEAGPEEEAELRAFREERSRRIMAADLEEVFQVKEAGPLPRKARIMATLVCEVCGEPVMESRTHRLGGRVLCGPCFEKEENRL